MTAKHATQQFLRNPRYRLHRSAAILAAVAVSTSALMVVPSSASTPPSLLVNFQPASVAVPAGYVADTGLPFSMSRGYGWLDSKGVPTNISASTRVRHKSSDPRLDTLIQVQDNGKVDVWRANIADATYNVTVTAGDPSFLDSRHVVTVNGAAAIAGFVPTASKTFDTVTVTTTVTDGKLTLAFAGGTNTKLDYVTIVPTSTTVTGTPAKVNLAWFYNAPQAADMKTVEANFSSYILSDGQRSARDVLRAADPNAQFLQYVLFQETLPPDSTGTPLHNNVAWLKGDFASMLASHPDWFLRDSGGKPLISGGKYYWMDPGSAGFRQFWVSRIASANSSYAGVFADNVEVSLCGRERDGQATPEYTTDAAYTTAIKGFLQYAYTNYFKPNKKQLIVNLVNSCSNRNAGPSYMSYVDGTMEEGVYVDWHTSYLSASGWQTQMTRMETALASGKQVISVAQGAQSDTAREQFGLASYFLIWTPKLYFRYAYAPVGYDTPWMYANYKDNLGVPVGSRYQQSDGSWRRDFSNGHVVVDPTKRTSSITVT